ncbi:TonB-dependent receptor [Paracnuella aquatica]|nr:TonB-dependent receptor [Paracnuella aquatica]
MVENKASWLQNCTKPKWGRQVSWRNIGVLLTLLLIQISNDVHAAPAGVAGAARYDERTAWHLFDMRITGTVTDSTGQRLANATVTIKENGAKTSTNAEGFFTIQAPDAGGTLQVSFIGYQTFEVSVTNAGHQNIRLAQQVSASDEVVVVGFGKQKRASVVGAIQSVKPEELRIPTSNLSNSFAGKLAGVIAVQRSGQPGADGASFFIRGISTFSGATNPLIILDGVAVSAGDLNALAPEVIESFSILKDATATAIYGSRGANGVMIVTTKRGKNLDKPRINIRIENSVAAPTSVPKFVDGVRFMELYNEAVIGRSTGEIPYSADKIEGTRQGLDPYLYPSVNWYDELFKSTAMNQSANVNVMGGGQKVDYFMSATFNHDNGILKKSNLHTYDNNISVKRYSFQNNLNAQLSPSTKFALRLNTQIRDYHGPAKDANAIFGDVMNANGVDFPVMFPSAPGSNDIRYGGKSGGRVNDGYINPFAEMVRGYTDNFQSTIVATVDGEQQLNFITPGLAFKALGSFKNWSNTNTNRSRGYNQFLVDNIVKNPDGTVSYDLTRVGTVQNETLGTSTAHSGDRTIYFQTSLDYNRTFAGVHNVSGLLLYNQQEYNVNNPDGLIASLPRRSQGFAGRVTYAFDNRYMLEANFGYNGSENFAEGKRFGFFPSVAGGYVVSNEKFWEPLERSIKTLKLRGSWGLVGNDQIGGARFVYLSDINLGGQGYTSGVNQDYTRNGPSYLRFANPNITWEVAEKINVGMDLSLANGINLVVDIFKENRKGIFLQRQVIPESFGTLGTTVYGNLGAVRNQGIDVSLDYTKAVSRDLQVTLKGTFTYAHNTVVENDEPPFTKYKNLSLVGHPINSLLGYQAERLFIDDAEVVKSPLQQLGGFVTAGDIKYRDITNGIDGLNMVNSDDRVYMGYPTIPEIVYGFGPSFRYKKLDLSFFFQGVTNTSFFINGFHPFGTSDQRNVLQFIDDNRWSPGNPNIFAQYPRLSKLDNPNNTANSSYWLRDGSFLKLRNAEVGYNYKFARIYLSGFNLLTFSKFKLWDPEQGGGNGLGYPTKRIVNVGVQLGL